MQTIENPFVDRRQYARSTAGCPASFEHDRGVVRGVLVDISFFGALLQLQEDHSLSTHAGTLVVPFGRDPEEAVRVSAKVVYRRDRAVGLNWESLSPEDIIKVRRLSSGDPSRPWMLMRPAHTLFFLRRAR